MKATLLKLTALLLILAGVAATCNKPPLDYSVNIPFTEYSLDGTQCQWANLAYDGKVIIINSNEELEKYITCASKNYPEIDFSKNTLLLTSGKTANNFLRISKNLQKVSSDEYELNIEITPTTTTVDREWSMALMTEKLNEKNSIKVNTNYKKFEDGSGIYYVVGYNMSCGVIAQGETAKANVYLLASENLDSLLITANFPDDIFKFPTTILFSAYCAGRIFFPKEYHFTYPVRMSYRLMTDEDIHGPYITNCPVTTDKGPCEDCFGGPHYDYGTSTPFFVLHEPIIIESISKFE